MTASPHAARRLAALVAAVGLTAVAGCSLIPGLPNVTTNGTVVVTYDGKPVPADIGKLICTFDGKGNVAFLSGNEKSGDTFVGAYTTDGQHTAVIKTADYPMGLVAGDSDSSKDITKATVDKQVYTFEGTMTDLSTVATGQPAKKPFKAVITCK